MSKNGMSIGDLLAWLDEMIALGYGMRIEDGVYTITHEEPTLVPGYQHGKWAVKTSSFGKALQSLYSLVYDHPKPHLPEPPPRSVA